MYARPVRSVVKAFVVVLLVALLPYRAASADDLAPFAGKLVISPDAPPTESGELPAYLKANLTKDASYPIVKGPPWSMHIVGVLAKDTKQVTLVIREKPAPVPKPTRPIKNDKPAAKTGPATALVTIDLVPKHRVVMAHTDATVAAGFASGKRYDVRLVAGKVELAKAELVIRD